MGMQNLHCKRFDLCGLMKALRIELMSCWIFSSQVVGCLTNGPSTVFFLPIIGEVANGKKLLCVSHTEDASVSRDLS